MGYIATAFKSRAHTVAFSEFLRKNGVPNEIINTPKEAGVGCGLSVKTGAAYYKTIKRAVYAAGFNSFAGCFLVKIYGGKRIVRSI